MKKAPPFFVLCSFLIVFVFFPLKTFAYDPFTTHPYLTSIITGFFNQFSQNNRILETEKQLIMKGSTDEDTSSRCLNHFYDPIYNKTWQFGGIEYFYPALIAKEWAQNPFAQALYDPLYTLSLGLIRKSPVYSQANFTWQKAIYEYAKGNKIKAFESLGHVLHLIEDMGVPEHVREDSHPSFLGPDATENYPTYFSFNVYSDILKEAIKSNSNLLKYNTLDEAFNDIALYTNKYFYSFDTILDSHYKDPQYQFYDVSEIDKDGTIKKYLLGIDENKTFFHLAKKQGNWRLQIGFNLYTLNDEKVLSDYWSRLSKKITITGASIINLFFKEVEKIKSDPNFLSKNEQNILTAALNGVNTFISNIFQKNSDYIVVNSSSTVSSLVSNHSMSNFTSQPTTTITPLVSTTILNRTTTTLKPTTTTLKSTTTTLKLTTTTTALKTTTTTTLKTNLCNFLTSQYPFRNKIIINEVAWMGTQNSSNDEWMELKNISSGIIDLSNWQLIDQDEQIKIIFPNNIRLESGQFLLLERTNDETVPNTLADIIYVGNLTNQNEDLRLFDNSCQLQDEVFAQPDWLAGDNISKRTMERKLDLTWQTSVLINGTPKQENSNGYVVVNSGGSSNVSNTTTITTVTTPTNTQTTTTITTTTTIKPNYPKILINEIKVAGLSSDGKTNVYDEFIELYNQNDFEVNLTGWYLQKKTSQSNEFSSLVPSDLFDGKIINPSGYFLISHSSSTYQDIADILDSNYSVTDNNTIVFKNPNREIVDKVGFGEANDCERNCALNPGLNQSFQRKYIENNFLDTDDNFNDFEIQDCPSPKTLSNSCFPEETTTTTRPPITSTPSIPYITEFSWHPFDKDFSKIVIDFKTNSYPFIPPTNYTDNVFTAMAFYLHLDSNDSSSDFGIPTDYLGGQDSWSLGGIPALVISYPNCQGYTWGSSALVFTNSESWCRSPGGSRGLSYNWGQLPKDNHFLVDVTGTTNGQGLNFTADQYVTIGYYGYANSPSSYLKLIAYDPTKFYFNAANYYHQPTNVLNFDVQCDNSLCNNLIFSWTSASDEDLGDILKYDIHYVFSEQEDSLSNNNLTRQTWEWSASQNVLGEPIFNSETNRFSLQVSINDSYYLKAKRLPGVPLDVFFGIKAQDNEGLKSEIPKIIFLNIPPIVP